MPDLAVLFSFVYGNETYIETDVVVSYSKLANHISVHLSNYMHKQITSLAGNESPIPFFKSAYATRIIFFGSVIGFLFWILSLKGNVGS